MIGIGTNALASSVVLVCSRRQSNAGTISRREFIRELNAVLPEALAEMTSGGEHSPVAPVDLSQAIIGPGVAIFSKYSAVLEADGKAMSVRTALQLINRFLAEDDFDHDTQFCLGWFDGYGWDKGKFGDADVLARAKGTSVQGLADGGIVESISGTLRLLRSSELPEDWSPESDSRISMWEILHHMIRRLNSKGESGAGEILAKASSYSDHIRTLAYRLYTLCERKGWAQDAGQYNSLVLAWEAIETAARSTGYSGSQISLFGEDKPALAGAAAPKAKTRKKK
jgi:putative DNA methylase